MRKILILVVLLLALPVFAQQPRVITTDIDPDGLSCTLLSPPMVLVYHSGSTTTHYSCTSSTWSAVPSGDVTGPGSSVDNEIVKFDSTTGKVIQGSTSNQPTVTDDGTLRVNGQILTDTISEDTASAGVTVESVKIEDGQVDMVASAGTDSTNSSFLVFPITANPEATQFGLGYRSTTHNSQINNLFCMPAYNTSNCHSSGIVEATEHIINLVMEASYKPSAPEEWSEYYMNFQMPGESNWRPFGTVVDHDGGSPDGGQDGGSANHGFAAWETQYADGKKTMRITHAGQIQFNTNDFSITSTNEVVGIYNWREPDNPLPSFSGGLLELQADYTGTQGSGAGSDPADPGVTRIIEATVNYDGNSGSDYDFSSLSFFYVNDLDSDGTGNGHSSGDTTAIHLGDMKAFGSSNQVLRIASQSGGVGHKGNLQFLGGNATTGHIEFGTGNDGDHIWRDDSNELFRAITDSTSTDPNAEEDGGPFVVMEDHGTLTAAATVSVTNGTMFATLAGTAASIETINTCDAGHKGRFLILDCGFDATVLDDAGGGNLHLATDFTCNGTVDIITLICTGSYWQELSRSDN